MSTELITSSPESVRAGNAGALQLKRVLGFWDLVIYGMIIVQVVAPVPIAGLLEQRSNGHAVTVVLLALFGMMLTAVSYGRMAVVYPMAGSAYSYVARSINPHLGFFAGWAMFLDYLLIPLISAMIPALAIQRLLPQVPFAALTFLVVLGMTVLNLRGMQTTARANLLLLTITALVVGWFVVAALEYLWQREGWGGIFSMHPIYNPRTFDGHAIFGGISLAVLSYIGFDGVSTLAEDVVNPKRNVVLATVLVCFLTGLLSATELYFFHQVIPDWKSVADPNTYYLDVMKVVGGPLLFTVFSVIMSLSQFGAGFTGQVSAARLLYGMGRDNVLPSALFGYLSPRRQNPSRNIILIGILAFVGTLLVPFDTACDLLNFGAYLGFMGVNLSTFFCYYLRPPEGHHRHFLWDAFFPLIGFGLCFVCWLGLPRLAQIVGGTWLVIGMAYAAFKTNGFRKRPLLFEFNDN
jgi:amino acid transporter